MAKIIESRRILKSRLDAKQDVLRAIPALMGDGNGNVAIANQPGYVYIRIGDGDLGQAFNNRCPQRDNLAIYVGYDPVTDPDRRTFQVLSVRMADYAGAGNTPTMNVPPHDIYHEFGGGDDVYIDWRRLMGLRVGRPSGFSVTTDPGVILRAGVWTAVASQTLALAAMKPAGLQQARYVLIVLNAAGVATATAGALKTIATLAISDCPIPGAGEIPLAAVRLYGIQTSIGDVPSAPDIVDLRFPQTTMTGTVFLSSLSGWARGSIIRGGAAVWEAYALGGITGSVVTRDATDVVWSSFALAGTAAQTYTFPAVTGGVALGAGGLTNATLNDATIANHTHAITGTFTPGAHDILSASHGDTLAAAVVRGSLIYGNATPKWASLGLGGITGSLVTRDATDVKWSAGALSFGGAFTLTISNNASIGGTAITGTPGTLTVSSVNASADPHTHAITSSSNPGAASILATDASGGLAVKRLGVNRAIPGTDGYVDISANYQIGGINMLSTYGTANYFIGPSGNYTMSGNSNMAMGSGALAALTSASGCMGIGVNALLNCQDGSSNCAVGTNALTSVTSGTSNVGIGNNAGRTRSTTNDGVFIGSSAGFYAKGAGAIGIGAVAVYGGSAANTTGTYPIGIGYAALGGMTTGHNNIGIGFYAGNNTNAVTTTNFNIFIGNNTGFATANQRTYATVIGNYAYADADYVCILGGIGVYAQNVGIAVQAPAVRLHVAKESALTNTIQEVVRIAHNTTGVAAAGFGSALDWYLESSTTADTQAARIKALWNDATHASRYADLVLSAYGIGTEYEFLRGRGGAAAMIGFLGATPIVRAVNTTALDTLLVNYGLRVTGGYANFDTTIKPRTGTAAANTSPIIFTSGALLATPEAGAMEFYDGRWYITGTAKQRVIDRTSANVNVADVTVANSNAETTLYTWTLSANAMKVGRIYKLNCMGIADNKTASDDITFNLYFGGTLVGTYNPAMGSIAAGTHWHANMTITVRTVGIGGTCAVDTDIEIGTFSESVSSLQAIDTTIVSSITLKVQWDNADPANTITLYQAFLEFRN